MKGDDELANAVLDTLALAKRRMTKTDLVNCLPLQNEPNDSRIRRILWRLTSLGLLRKRTKPEPHTWKLIHHTWNRANPLGRKKVLGCKFPGCTKPHCAKGYCNSHWAQQNRHGEKVMTPLKRIESPATCFWRNINKNGPDGCWVWLSSPTGKFRHDPINPGYGILRCKGRQWMAHRFAYLLMIGDIPDGYEIDHCCQNKMCVNPDHLELVTQDQQAARKAVIMSMLKTIKRLRKQILNLGGDPDANIPTAYRLRRLCEGA